MEQLISASIGIFEVNKRYYLQVITADKENHYFIPLGIGAAVALSESEHLEITPITKLPKGEVLKCFVS